MAGPENQVPEVVRLRKFFSKIYIYSGSRRKKQIEKKSIRNVRTDGILGGTIQINALYALGPKVDKMQVKNQANCAKL